MAGQKLNSLFIQRAHEKGRYGDGQGLYLQVSSGGSKSWLFRYTLNGKCREMGLGSVETLSLADARMRAQECRRRLIDGIDPIEQRKERRREEAHKAARATTFTECAEAYIESHRAGWKNAKHAAQWTSTLTTYAYPVIGKLSVQAIDTALVMKILEPIWPTKTETASRLRNRIELILSWATVREYRSGPNPAQWRGHLDKLLPKRSKIAPKKHFASLPYQEVSQFMQALRKRQGISPRALEVVILTAVRTNEALKAKWSEFDFQEAIWKIPGSRTKNGKEHRVPLTSQVVAILNAVPRFEGNNHVFPGVRGLGHLSNMALLEVVREMKIPITVHGFRSSFSTWAREKTSYPRDVVEMALGHSIKDAVEAAYFRGDLFLKRQALMRDWARYCDQVKPAKGELISFHGPRVAN